MVGSLVNVGSYRSQLCSIILCVSPDKEAFFTAAGIKVQDSMELAVPRAGWRRDLPSLWQRPVSVCLIFVLSGHASVPGQVHQVTKSLTGSSHFCSHSIIVAEDLLPGEVKWLTQGHRAKYVGPRNKVWSPDPHSSFSRNYMDMWTPRAGKTPSGPRRYLLRALCTSVAFPVGRPWRVNNPASGNLGI